MSPAPGAVVLVVAKAPVPRRAKTRLSPPLPPEAAADIAAAALLDTLDVARDAADRMRGQVVVAYDDHGVDERRIARSQDVARALAKCIVLRQRGCGLAERLANAHSDAAHVAPGAVVVQVGMDTPQMSVESLVAAAARVQSNRDTAVLAPAPDGGWWLLAVADPTAADVLRAVPVSTPHTAETTLRALRARGLHVVLGSTLRDVDTWDDLIDVQAQYDGRMPAAYRARSLSLHNQ
jgi:glycosyltransferase A (GT-A) superfamily protein (DUF2064 family)